MLELFQAEWCPASARVRQRLTELGVDYVVRQVPVERSRRTRLRAMVGADSIPALRLENGSPVVGEENILAYLAEHFIESPQAGARVIGTASESRHGSFRELGAEPLVYGPGLLGWIQELGPDGVDVAVDAAAGAEALDASLALVTGRDRIVTLPAVWVPNISVSPGGQLIR